MPHLLVPRRREIELERGVSWAFLAFFFVALWRWAKRVEIV